MAPGYGPTINAARCFSTLHECNQGCPQARTFSYDSGSAQYKQRKGRKRAGDVTSDEVASVTQREVRRMRFCQERRCYPVLRCSSSRRRHWSARLSTATAKTNNYDLVAVRMSSTVLVIRLHRCSHQNDDGDEDRWVLPCRENAGCAASKARQLDITQRFDVFATPS
jgi:hypothetical protein